MEGATGMTNVWSGVTDFAGGFITALGDIISDLLAQPVLLAFIFGLPISMMVIGWVRKLIGKRKG